ncbi:hypothetical protein [Reyranella sp.]|uniref:hypothetical protein n=1 Tax=Reyranella sp. TaxID=1929291 RepID=UPI003C7B86E6
MGALGWEIHEPDGLVVVSGVGLFDLSFIRAYRQAMQTEGAAHYRKLFDLHRSDIVLAPDDLRLISEDARNNAPTAGPIAIVMGRTPPPLLVDMAILLKDRMSASRRFRLFTEEAEARRWLAGEPISTRGTPVPSNILPLAKP